MNEVLSLLVSCLALSNDVVFTAIDTRGLPILKAWPRDDSKSPRHTLGTLKIIVVPGENFAYVEETQYASDSF